MLMNEMTLINVHFSNVSTRDCHVTRMDIVTTLAAQGVDANGNVKWLEANWMRIHLTFL